jgi:hypothetical protein
MGTEEGAICAYSERLDANRAPKKPVEKEKNAG